MTEFYLITAFQEAVSLLEQVFINYVSIVFAFIVAGYLIADKLKPSMVILVIVLFTAVAARQITNMYFIQHDLGVWSAEMALRIADGSFSYPGLKMTQNPQAYLFILQGLATIGAYFGAVFFFFYQRREGLKKLAD